MNDPLNEGSAMFALTRLFKMCIIIVVPLDL